MKNRYPTLTKLIPFLIGGLILAGCGGDISDDDIASTSAAATLIVEGRLPTIEAQMTQFGGQATPLPNTEADPPSNIDLELTTVANMTAVAEGDSTGEERDSSSGGGDAGSGAQPTSASSASSGGSGGAIGSGDEHDTTQTETISLGDTVSGQLLKAFDAHNWLFAGTAGQTITVTVDVIGLPTDPVIDFYGPEGFKLFGSDGGEAGQNESLTVILESTGTFAIRIRGWKVGAYTLTLTGS